MDEYNISLPAACFQITFWFDFFPLHTHFTPLYFLSSPTDMLDKTKEHNVIITAHI